MTTYDLRWDVFRSHRLISTIMQTSATLPYDSSYIATYVTGFERTRLPCTQQEHTLFTITQ